jgi:hypothetical protein
MNLLEIQREMAAAIMQPLTASGRVRKQVRGRSVSLIRPNERLTSLERLEIYSRSYWSRLLDSFREDFPGLQVVLGRRAFDQLAQAYLTVCPSCSFTLRDLGSRLESWLNKHPDYAGKAHCLALDMVRLEWAHIVAFDGEEETVLGPQDLLEPSANLRVGLQPYITLLQLNHPVDELRVAVRDRSEVSSAVSIGSQRTRRSSPQRLRTIRAERLFLAVHRLDSIVYYRRLSPEEFRLLRALRSGRPLAGAIRTAFDGSHQAQDVPEQIENWFSTWTRFGWLTSRPKSLLKDATRRGQASLSRLITR